MRGTNLEGLQQDALWAVTGQTRRAPLRVPNIALRIHNGTVWIVSRSG